ncbi:ROK family transcriptional regulator [Terrilactibacillus laevilacticus]|uniref:ROK family protein n=1 Tax=Terrilactibacillus laevilacticus TaxID=1380157 RepID=A0ABW5PNW9_9BACI|nr:ROK family transcriptional regulator [Terrilactibacillus laevilacticus]
MNNSAAHLDLIKKINRSLILEKIKTEQPISRAQIAKKLSLSKSTVSTIVDELLNRKFVIELGEQSPVKGGGRPALMLGFNPKSAFGIGVDIDRANILIIITDLVGNIVFRKKVPSTNHVMEIINIIKECIKESKIPEEKIIGMGIGVPGRTDNETVFRAKALNWTNLHIGEMFKPYFSFPTFTNNDVNCAGLGEMWLDPEPSTKNLFFIEIGHSIGSAIISNGNLVYGYNYQAGEIAYQISTSDIKNKKFNMLGQPGVFESKISGTALEKSGYSPEILFKKYSQGEKEVIQTIESFVTELSVFIANAINLLNPEKVIIGGYVSESMDVVLNEIQEMVMNLTPIKTKIQLASLGANAGSLGAIAFMFNQVESN